MNDPQAPIAIGPDRLCWDGSRPRGRCRDWSCIDALFFAMNTSTFSRVVLYLRRVSRVTARCHWHVDQRHGRCQWRVAARHHGVGVRADVCLSEMSLDECEPCELRRSGAAAQLHDGRSNWSAAGLLAVISSAAVATTGAKGEPWSVVWRELSKPGLARSDRGSLCRESARESAFA